MNIIFLDGSPKGKGSTSVYLLNGLSARLGGAHNITWLDARKQNTEALALAMQNADALVIAFPLYVDGIPSHLLRFMEAAQADLFALGRPAKVYCMVNSGFYDARQNHIALAMARLWAEKCGLVWAGGLGIGGGGMAQMSPLEQGPGASIGRAIGTLATAILLQEQANDAYIEPNFPRFLYKAAAHIGWRRMAQKNGITAREMKRRIPLNTNDA